MQKLGFIVAIGIVIGGVWILAVVQRPPVCHDVLNRYFDQGQWVQRIQPEYWEAPSWAHDVRKIKCRDGVVATWTGEYPDNWSYLP